MEVFLQQVINGVTIGSIYGLIAIGYTMVYGIIGMVNFAHGDVFMVSAFFALIFFLVLTSWLGLASITVALILVMVISMVLTGLLTWAIERVAYAPLRNSFRLAPLISAIGMSIFLQNVVRLAQGSRDIAMPSLITGGWSIGPEEGFHATLSYMQLVIFIVTFITMTALTLFISRSRMGRACRACAEDIKMTNLLGINTNNVIALTFVIGAALAAVAGVLLSLYYGVINPYIGFMAGLKAFTAAVLGGIGSIPGAVLGGLLLGVTEAITAGYFSTEYKDVVAFSLLILILLFRPTGILGRPEVEKV